MPAHVAQLTSFHNMPAPCECHARQVSVHRSLGERKAKTARQSSLQTVSSLPAVEARPVEQDSQSRVHSSNGASSNGASTSDRGSLAERVRADFPILDQHVNNKPLVYLDNAATSQKPLAVRRIMDEYYGPQGCNSNVHRGVHNLAARATAAYEGARAKVARFINARSDREVVWCRNASEGINLVAYTWGLENLKPGDEILSTVAEHHSNLVPWQIVAQKTGAVLRHVPLTQDGQEVDMKAFHEMLSSKTKLVAMVHVSNMLGCILPAAQVAEAAHKVGAKVMLDCCQSVPHMAVDVQQLGADWIVASGHKMVGPTGSAFLWGRQEILESMPPWMGGGEMIQDVFLDRSTYAPPPSRFEAGTPAIAEAIGLGAAVDYLQDIGMHQIHDYEEDIGGYLQQELRRINGVTVYGPRDGAARAALASFNVEGLHATDISSLLDNEGVAVRSGHHCTQPLHHHLGIAASARASAYLYNTYAEIDSFIAALKESIQFFRDAGM